MEILKRIVFPQWITGVAVTLVLVEIGISAGWSSPVIPKLRSEHFLNDQQKNWVATLLNVGRFLGSVTGPISVNYLGSKRTILLSLIPMTVGWMLMIPYPKNYQWLYCARLSNGIGFGMAYGAFPLYIGEVSMPNIRGALIALAAIGVPFGQFLASILNSRFSIEACALIYTGLCATLIAIFVALPDSPHSLVKRDESEAAYKAIAWYRSNRGTQDELEAVEQFVRTSGKTSFVDKLREFKNPPTTKATLHVVFLFTFMQLSGINSILYYMEDILTAAKFDLMKPADLVVLVNACAIFAASLAIVLIDRCGRRFLLILSAIGVTLSLTGMMVYFILLNKPIDLSNLEWLPATSMVLFVCTYYFGFMIVPNTVLGEYFPADVKCIATCVASLTGGAMSIVSTSTFNPMVDLITYPYVFLYHATCSFVMVPYAMIFFLETKGKTLKQIQDKLRRK